MILKTSKTLANILNKNIKEYNITQEQLNYNQFKLYVDFDIMEHEEDFDYNINKFNVIKVSYPSEYFANNQYITTKDLKKIFERSDKTLTDFIKRFRQYVEI